MRKMDERIKHLIEQGVGRRTAYRRIRVTHCSSCTCASNDTTVIVTPKKSVETLETKNIEDITRSSKFEFCSKHGSMKFTCGCLT